MASSSTTRSGAARPPDAEAVLASLHERVAARLPQRSELARAFALAAYRRIPADELARLDLDEAADQLVAALEFMDGRRAGELAVRVASSDSGGLVEINVEDGPFLLSTVTEELARLGLEAVDVMHPVFGVQRDGEGRIAAILPARQASTRESYIRLALDDPLSQERSGEVEAALRRVLSDALVATRDFPRMRAQLAEVAYQMRASAGSRYAADEVDEAQALLAWLLDDHFILLGVREYALVDTPEGRAAEVVAGSGLGILSDESTSSYAEPVLLDDVPPALRERMTGGDLLVVSRTNAISTVHRQVRMIYVGVKKVDGDGTISGEYRLLGLFAQKAFSEAASSIPVLRRKLRQILEREDIVDHSYDERAIRALFESFPKHELFSIHADDLRATLVQLLEIAKRHDVRLIIRIDPQRRSVSALVAVPRGRFNAQIRRRVQALLVDRFSATGVDYQLSMTERDQALLHFLLYTDGEVPQVDVDALEADVRALTRTFEDDVTDALVRAHGETPGRALARVWAAAFPAGYTEQTDPATAVRDIAELDALVDHDVRMRLDRKAGDPSDLLRFRLYKAGPGVELSSFLPILESLGLTVTEEVPHRIDGPSGQLHIHDFGVRAPGVELSVEDDGPRMSAAALAVWYGRAEADSLNRLVIHAGMAWDDVAVLRAYRRYRRQVGTSYSQPYENDALVAHPQAARALLELFATMFDPARASDDPEADARAVTEAHDDVLAALDEVSRLDIDRILRGYLGLVDATLRTNRYVVDDDGKPRPWLSLKFDSARVPDMPKPVPHVEVFVYHPDMEGVHLRGGPVSRGGLRWSDRLEDFRTEVLGLMKAQMTKNAIIVPTGSKGGFVLKRAGSNVNMADPAQRKALVRQQYETFIRGLLDVTDNVVGDHVVPPKGVRRVDRDDPYLVVAADRGTASFSDVANAISEEYGFWLGDAFASGGSRGYDHKAMGITARGAWVAVRRHFHELDIDVQTEPITVVGIGDMSGDVFGNGMLLSRAIKLVAAFDHRDIFVDPDPDPAASFSERQRLFALPSSSWQDYNRDVISTGGGVWPRTAKEIVLSPQIRAALGIEQERLSPPELIKAILRAPADLLFAGGVGTFVKASDETHADVGDRANDAIRVNATEVGARVIGEGGNLAVTQRGRIQYARRGGRCNTDAIDNSAGVDTSDHEVNLKILLRLAREEGLLSADERDDLLAEMTDDVAAQVLRDNFLQTWAISQELAYSPGGMEAYETLMTDLEESGRLDRVVEHLPSTAEVERRREAGAGFTRPELAVLLAYAKLDLTGRLLASDLPDQPYLHQVAIHYFPEAAVERFAALVARHRLRRELVATVVANEIVNRMGITWTSRTAHELGAMAHQAAAAYWIAREVTDADAHWRAIEATDGHIAPQLELELKAEVDRVVDACARTYLRQGVTADIAAAVERDRPAFEQLEKFVADRGAAQRTVRARVEHFIDLGIGDELAERLVAAGELTMVPDVAEVARSSGHDVRHVADVFVRVGEVLPLDVLYQRLQRVTPEGHWERWQWRGLVDELRDLRRAAALGALATFPDSLPSEAVEEFVAQHAAARDRARKLLALLEREGDAALDAIAVAVRALRGVTT